MNRNLLSIAALLFICLLPAGCDGIQIGTPSDVMVTPAVMPPVVQPFSPDPETAALGAILAMHREVAKNGWQLEQMRQSLEGRHVTWTGYVINVNLKHPTAYFISDWHNATTSDAVFAVGRRSGSTPICQRGQLVRFSGEVSHVGASGIIVTECTFQPAGPIQDYSGPILNYCGPSTPPLYR